MRAIKEAGESVSDRHVKIAREGDRFFIENMWGNHTEIKYAGGNRNTRLVQGRSELKDDTLIFLGPKNYPMRFSEKAYASHLPGIRLEVAGIYNEGEGIPQGGLGVCGQVTDNLTRTLLFNYYPECFQFSGNTTVSFVFTKKAMEQMQEQGFPGFEERKEYVIHGCDLFSHIGENGIVKDPIVAIGAIKVVDGTYYLLQDGLNRQ